MLHGDIAADCVSRCNIGPALLFLSAVLLFLSAMHMWMLQPRPVPRLAFVWRCRMSRSDV